MPLEPYKRGPVWWAKGRVELNGRGITDYIRESTGASTEAGARDWINARQQQEERRHLLGEDHALSFAEAVMLYPANRDTAKHLIPVVARLGNLPVTKITARMIRDLGRELYPNNSTDSWKRWVIAPARAVINNAADMEKCPHIRVKGYTDKERVAHDKKRGKKSRPSKTPGSWEWLLAFREHAPDRLGALALFMFSTGARIGQAIAMHPDALDLDNHLVTIPGAKGHDDRTVKIPPELVDDLLALAPRIPRGWTNRKSNLRVFGYAERFGPLKAWRTACTKAGIAYLPPHSAGRHGFGQEMRVRQNVDKKAIEHVGGWSAKGDMVDRTYTHAEDADTKILEALRTGRVQAEIKTGLKLAKMLGKQT